MSPSPADAVRDLYDRLPWPPPEGGPDSSNTLSTAWLQGVCHPRPHPLSPGRRVLIAGCGRGDEALGFARDCPDLHVVGVDLSPRSIALAQARPVSLAPDASIAFHNVDLTDATSMAALGRFDLVIAHAVLDYVPDSNALLASLAAALEPEGVLFVSINTPDHPAGRLRRAFQTLGADAVTVGPAGPRLDIAQRRALVTAAGLMGPDAGVPDLAGLSAELLAVDMFAPFAHHDDVDTWADRANATGLNLVGARMLPHALAGVSDAVLPGLAELELPTLIRLVSALRRWPSANLLFSPTPRPWPPWTRPELGRWVPALDASLPAQALPAWSAGSGPADRHIPLTVRTPGLPDLIVETTAAALEVLRRSDGRTPLDALTRDAGVGLPSVWPSLFRACTADLLHLAAPDR